MTLRTKTVEYAYPLSIGSVASAASRDFTSITVNIPETTSRTFRSVHLEVSCVDNVATAASVTAVGIGIQLNAVAIDVATVTQTIVNSGENQAFLFTRDVTAYFVTNFTSGFSFMTSVARLVVTGVSTINATAKLVITYEYDDAAGTQVKTVRVPMDGNTGNLTTGLVNLGGVAGQIPALNVFIPEAGAIYRSIFFQMDVHTGTTAAAAAALTMSYGGTNVTDTSWAYTLNTDTFYRRIDVLTSLIADYNATYTIQASTSSLTGAPFPCLNGYLVITYTFEVNTLTPAMSGPVAPAETTFDVDDTAGWPTAPFTVYVAGEYMRVTSYVGASVNVTRNLFGTGALSFAGGELLEPIVLNSSLFTAVDEAGWAGGTATGDKSRFQRDVLIQEPAPIRLAQSGAQIFQNASGAVTLDLRIGSQASRVFTHAATARGGGISSMRRFDSGAAGGAGVTLTSRGRVTFTVDFFTTSATAGNIGSNTNGITFLNYYSGDAGRGGSSHTHSTAWMAIPYETGGLVQKKVKAAAGIKTPIIPETDFYITGYSYWLALQTSGTAAGTLGVAFNGEIQAAESQAAGWKNFFSTFIETDAEVGPSITWCRARDDYRRFTADFDTDRLDPETARDLRLDCNVNAALIGQAVAWVTYYALPKTKVITVTGSSGGTVNVAVRWKDYHGGDKVWSGSRVGNGTVTATLFEDTDTKFTEVRESDALVGRSGDWT